MRQRRTILGSWKLLFGAGVLAGGLALFAGVPSAQAEDECRERMHHAERKLDEAIERHGYYSRQANHQRHELDEAREYCWKHGRRFRYDRDRDDYDRYRDPYYR